MTPVLPPQSQQKSAIAFSHLALSRLQELVQGSVLLPDHAEFEAAWQPWSIGIRHEPALIVVAETAQDIVEAVLFARDHELPVGVQATGHGPSIPNIGGVMINTSRMRGVTIDLPKRTVRAEAGAVWADVLPVVTPYGLAPLNGSSFGVGVVGYTLGGGIGWLCRKYGFAADRVTSVDLVTADGNHITVDPDHYSDLFWGIRGGSGNFGIVTAIEFEVLPVATFFGGTVFYPLELAEVVFPAYLAWSAQNPGEVTSSISMMRFPPAPFIPEPLRGKSLIGVRACVVGENGEEKMAPMRALGTPVVDTFAQLPYAAIDQVSMDPVDPIPTIETSLTFNSFSADAMRTLLNHAGPDAETPILALDLRHIGQTAHQDAGALSCATSTDAEYLLFAVAIPMNPEMLPEIRQAIDGLHDDMRPYSNDMTLMNFLHHSHTTDADTRSAFTADTFDHLTRLKTKYDPTNRFRFNRNIKPAIDQ